MIRMTNEVSILPIQSMYAVDNHVITPDVLNEEPLIVKFHNVLSNEECQALIECAASRLERSKLANKEISQIRTSSGMFFDENENPLITTIEKRVSALMNLPIEHAEGLQILHYKPGEEFKAHFDYFGAHHPSNKNNRISSLVMYLNEVEQGGETTFPNLGLTVTPTKCSAVYFEYFYNDQRLNELTLHSGAPVIRGEKWVATQWIRKQRVRE